MKQAIERLYDLDHPGWDIIQKIEAFCDKAADVDYRTEDGDRLYDVFEAFGDMFLKHPRSIEEHYSSEECAAIRAACYALYVPFPLEDWQRERIVEAVNCLRKPEVIDALAHYGSTINEYFRLLWIVREHEGWRKAP